MKAGCDVEILRFIRSQEALPQGEIDNYQVDVKLEVLTRADPIDDRSRRHQLETDDPSIPILRPKKGDGAAIEPEQRRRSPTRCDIEGFVAPFRDASLGDERIDHRVDGSADRLDITADQQAHLLLLDREGLRKSP